MSRLRAPWWMWAVAATFIAYFTLLLHCDLVRPEPEGFEVDFVRGQMVMTGVMAGSPAAAAGLRGQDRIATWNGQKVASRADLTALEANIEFDRPIRLAGLRGDVPFETSMVLRREPLGVYVRRQAGVSLLVVRAIQLVTLALGLFLAIRRPYDPAARVGGWLFVTAGVFCVVLPYRIGAAWRSLGTPLGAALWIPLASTWVMPAILLSFFLLLPVRRLRPAWGWAAVWAPILLASTAQANWHWHTVYRPAEATGVGGGFLPLLAVGIGYAAATLVVLAQNYRRVSDTTERRRLRVLLVGTAVGCCAAGLLYGFFWLSSSHLELLGSPAFILGTFCIFATPLAFTYAVLRHRLFDVTVIIRQGVQYAVAKNALLSVVPVVLLLLVADLLLHRSEPVAVVLVSRASVYVVLAGLAAVAHRHRKPWLDALDRRFFRERYDASRLLRQLAEDLRTSRSLDRAASTVVAGIDAALHPEFVALLVREPDAPSYQALAAVGSRTVAPFAADSKLLELARVLGRPLPTPAGAQGLLEHLPADEIGLVREGGIEMIVPVPGAPGERQATLALGLKRSEEPYSGEDRELLSAIAGSLALLLEAHPSSALLPETVSECPACGMCHDPGQATCRADGAALVQVRVPRVLAGRYRLERRLGAGGMGTVYEARDASLDRAVAVKLLREDLVGNADAAERFRQEARTAAAFAHPNVVTVHDFGVAAGRGFLVMELLAGATLREALARRFPFAVPEVLAILRGVTAAVSAAHERKIVHRDLKPENVFLAGNGESETIKVLDFGIAKFVGTSQAPGTTGIGTGIGMLVGTLPYMAPEQLRGEEVTPGWDLWALAVIACEMLTGRHPFALVFTGPSTAASQVSLLESLSALSPGSQAFLQRALAPEPERRPATATAFLAGLEEALRTE